MERENNRLKVLHSMEPERRARITQPALPGAEAAPPGPGPAPPPPARGGRGGGGGGGPSRTEPGRAGSPRTCPRRGAPDAAGAPAFVSPGTGRPHRLHLGETPAAAGLERMTRVGDNLVSHTHTHIQTDRLGLSRGEGAGGGGGCEEKDAGKK